MRRTTISFVILSVIASALNYLLYPTLSRILPVGEYVNITVALSLFTQVSTFLSSIIAVTISLSKFGDEESAHIRVAQLQSLILRVFLVLACFFLAFSPFIMQWAHTPLWFSVPIAVMMLFSIPITIISGYMNGRNLIVKLGLITVLSASVQFMFAVSASLIFHNGLVTIIFMTVSQLLSIMLVYLLFHKDKLPRLSLRGTTASVFRSKESLRLVRYTVASGVAVMAISLVQLLDLIAAQGLMDVNIKQYTDLYVLGRVVFFAGMIIVWPFLGTIDVRQLRNNITPFVRTVAFFMAILAVAMAGIYLFGEFLTRILFGAVYSSTEIAGVIFLSMLYKVLLLVITVCVLYFIVIRNQIAIWLSIITSILLFTCVHFLPHNVSLVDMLLVLNTVTAISAVTGVVCLIIVSRHTDA